MSEQKTNTQLLKEMQDIADEITKRKSEVEVILNVIDELEVRYYNIAEAIKKNSTSNAR
jgi:hypothetical protein